ncbi:hypothetical protein K501DRAFT_304586 [Backusella circina FSU 941]|nr:hypothetical protein K501DRAFT_304586 [Backusella circina FSU 941]
MKFTVLPLLIVLSLSSVLTAPIGTTQELVDSSADTIFKQSVQSGIKQKRSLVQTKCIRPQAYPDTKETMGEPILVFVDCPGQTSKSTASLLTFLYGIIIHTELKPMDNDILLKNTAPNKFMFLILLLLAQIHLFNSVKAV